MCRGGCACACITRSASLGQRSTGYLPHRQRGARLSILSLRALWTTGWRVSRPRPWAHRATRAPRSPAAQAGIWPVQGGPRPRLCIPCVGVCAPAPIVGTNDRDARPARRPLFWRPPTHGQRRGWIAALNALRSHGNVDRLNAVANNVADDAQPWWLELETAGQEPWQGEPASGHARAPPGARTPSHTHTRAHTRAHARTHAHTRTRMCYQRGQGACHAPALPAPLGAPRGAGQRPLSDTDQCPAPKLSEPGSCSM